MVLYNVMILLRNNLAVSSADHSPTRPPTTLWGEVYKFYKLINIYKIALCELSSEKPIIKSISYTKNSSNGISNSYKYPRGYLIESFDH